MSVILGSIFLLLILDVFLLFKIHSQLEEMLELSSDIWMHTPNCFEEE